MLDRRFVSCFGFFFNWAWHVDTPIAESKIFNLIYTRYSCQCIIFYYAGALFHIHYPRVWPNVALSNFHLELHERVKDYKPRNVALAFHM